MGKKGAVTVLILVGGTFVLAVILALILPYFYV